MFALGANGRKTNRRNNGTFVFMCIVSTTPYTIRYLPFIWAYWSLSYHPVFLVPVCVVYPGWWTVSVCVCVWNVGSHCHCLLSAEHISHISVSILFWLRHKIENWAVLLQCFRFFFRQCVYRVHIDSIGVSWLIRASPDHPAQHCSLLFRQNLLPWSAVSDTFNERCHKFSDFFPPSTPDGMHQLA